MALPGPLDFSGGTMDQEPEKVAPEGTRGDDRRKWENLNSEALSPVLGVWGRSDFSGAS